MTVDDDFEICPTEPDTPGYLRRVCRRGAETLVIQDIAGLKAPFQIRSTRPGTGNGLTLDVIGRRRGH